MGDLHLNGQIHRRELAGELNMSVNFANTSVSGTLDLHRQSTQANWASVAFSGPLESRSMNGEGLSFGEGTGAISGANIGSGEVQGIFYGPNGTRQIPPEAGGLWWVNKTDGSGAGAGIWRAKKQ